jgi:YkoY family integral membrane protein
LTFSPSDLLIVGTLIILEGLLSADNALVLALLVRHLPGEQQKRALLYGLVGAFVLRGLGITFAKWMMGLWWICGIGSLYLIVLAVRHFLTPRHDDEGDEAAKARGGRSFWATVAVVELTDLVFAVDSILVAVALVHDPSKVWIVYAGGFLGIILLRIAASFFIKLIHQYPSLDNTAYMLVGWAGVKLASASLDIYYRALGRPEPHLMPKWLFWVVFALIVIFGTLYALRHKATKGELEEVAEGEESLEELEESGFVIDAAHAVETDAERAAREAREPKAAPPPPAPAPPPRDTGAGT